MKIAFLGLSTDDKRFLLLVIAKIASYHTNVSILTKHSYTFENVSTLYEYSGIEIIIYRNEKNLLEMIPKGDDDCVFIDVEDNYFLPNDFRTITICEPTRKELESSVELTRQIASQKPSLNISVIYLNIMEYSKVSKKFLDLFWDQGFCDYGQITFTHSIYFEDTNRAMMIDCQYSNKVPIKGLSLALKTTLKGIIQDIFKLDSKSIRDSFKKAEREK